MMETLAVWKIGKNKPVFIGTISANPIRFAYAEEYRSSAHARPISLSLPLTDSPYGEDAMRPYFNGLLPENETRAAIARALNTTPDDFLAMLLNCGREIIGDIAITEGEEPDDGGSYESLSTDDMNTLFTDLSSLAESNKESRLSLAGSQGKTGLAHDPDKPLDQGWFRPLEGAASTHVVKVSALEDIPLLEYLCMRAAKRLEIRVPNVDLLELSRPALCVERFDRKSRMLDGALSVERLHQEDFAQAFGVTSSAKYSELVPTTAEAVTKLLRRRSSRPIDDLGEFTKVALFNYLVGNCDNHLKNLSILYASDWSSFRLAPAYDLVSTTRYNRFSTEMGMAINGKREISEIDAKDWMAFAQVVGIHADEMSALCAHLTEHVHSAISQAEQEHPSLAELGWLADELCEEMSARWTVLRSIAEG